jgi:hypothetical protein
LMPINRIIQTLFLVASNFNIVFTILYSSRLISIPPTLRCFAIFFVSLSVVVWLFYFTNNLA